LDPTRPPSIPTNIRLSPQTWADRQKACELSSTRCRNHRRTTADGKCFTQYLKLVSVRLLLDMRQCNRTDQIVFGHPRSCSGSRSVVGSHSRRGDIEDMSQHPGVQDCHPPCSCQHLQKTTSRFSRPPFCRYGTRVAGKDRCSREGDSGKAHHPKCQSLLPTERSICGLGFPQSR
jgi:hypothetical protein